MLIVDDYMLIVYYACTFTVQKIYIYVFAWYICSNGRHNDHINVAMNVINTTQFSEELPIFTLDKPMLIQYYTVVIYCMYN